MCVVVAFPLGCIANAQQAPPTTLAFDVSTVRPSSADAQGANLNLGSDSIQSSNLPVMFLLKFAFNLNGGSDDQIIGSPSWVSSRRFDIRAKVDEATAARLNGMTQDERVATLRKMMQALLADRFKLQVHHETRELPVMALTIAKGGPRLTQVSDAPVRAAAGASTPATWSGLHNPRAGETEGRDVPIALLASALSDKGEIGGRLVVDDTGLTGKYNFKLLWTPEDRDAAPDAPGAGGPSLFTALKEQLGLMLVSKRAPVDCVVIDHIEQPSPN